MPPAQAGGFFLRRGTMARVQTLPIKPSAAALAAFEPNPVWFAKDAYGIHGIAHEARVLIWSQVLAHAGSVNAETLAWAAAVHDTQRLDDGDDPGHGARAAKWSRARLPQLAPEADIEAVAYLCQWHVPPDHLAPRLTPELAAFKDADALDRWRIADFDPRFLRTPAAPALIGPSEALWKATRRVGLVSARGAFRDVLAAAADLGILAT